MMMLFWGLDQRRLNVMDRDRLGRVLLLVFEVRDLQGAVVDEEEEEEVMFRP